MATSGRNPAVDEVVPLIGGGRQSALSTNALQPVAEQSQRRRQGVRDAVEPCCRHRDVATNRRLLSAVSYNVSVTIGSLR